MSTWATPIIELAEYFYVFNIVDEYEAGLLFRKGRVKPTVRRLSEDEEAEYYNTERRMALVAGKTGLKRWLPWVRPNYGEILEGIMETESLEGSVAATLEERVGGAGTIGEVIGGTLPESTLESSEEEEKLGRREKFKKRLAAAKRRLFEDLQKPKKTDLENLCGTFWHSTLFGMPKYRGRNPYRGEEREVAREYNKLGFIGRWNPFHRPRYEDGFRKSFLFARPMHGGRFTKELAPGFFWKWPIVDTIETIVIKQRTESLGEVSLDVYAGNGYQEMPPEKKSGTKKPVKKKSGTKKKTVTGNPAREKDALQLFVDDGNGDLVSVMMNCILRYEVADPYKAFVGVNDYEEDVDKQAQVALGRSARELAAGDGNGGGILTYADLNDPSRIEQLEKRVIERLRTVATREWGLKIRDFALVDYVRAPVYRLLHEGTMVDVNISTGEDE